MGHLTFIASNLSLKVGYILAISCKFYPIIKQVGIRPNLCAIAPLALSIKKPAGAISSGFFLRDLRYRFSVGDGEGAGGGVPAGIGAQVYVQQIDAGFDLLALVVVARPSMALLCAHLLGN